MMNASQWNPGDYSPPAEQPDDLAEQLPEHLIDGDDAPDVVEAAPTVTELKVPDECGGLRFDAALARMLPEFSRSRLQAWMKEGLITVDGVLGDAKRKVWGGEVVLMTEAVMPENQAFHAEDIPLDVIYEDAAILIINKPIGLVVHPGSGNWSGTLLNGLLFRYPHLAHVPRAGIVHRLDKDTSGLMVVAQTLQAQTALVRQLQARTVRRHYYALTSGQVPQDGTVDAPIGRHSSQRTKMAVVGGGREARTHYTIQERFTHATLLECRLETGRTHQIRVHMATLGHPLIGDAVYGLRRRLGNPLLDNFPRQALHAWRLALTHPDTLEEMAWEAPLPDDFAQLLIGLRA